MKTDWDSIFEHHWDMYDPSCVGKRIRLPGTTDETIRDVERNLCFEFPSEFHECYLAANGFGIDGLLLVPIERLAQFITDSRAWLNKNHKDIGDRFFPFIDNERGPTGYFLEEDGQLSPYMMMMVRDRYCDDPNCDPDTFMELSAQSICDYLTC